MLEPVCTTVNNPTAVTQPPGESNRLFVTAKKRGIFVVENGVTLPTLFLDVDDEAAANGGLHTHGLMDMEFHPDYQTNGKFYISYMDELLFAHVAEYQVSAADPNVANPSTRVQILGPQAMSFQSHNFNDLWFGPDGMLYISTGDDEQTGISTVNIGQDLSNYLGKILRLDVDAPPPYIASGNPFIGVLGADERVFIYGLRQPWRFTYDPVTDDMFIGDVGETSREEISSVKFANAAGANFGWRCAEGTVCTNFLGGCPTGCNAPNFIGPAYEFDHSDGKCAVIAGDVYRGSDFPAIDGELFFADYCTSRIWSLTWDGASITNFTERTDQLKSINGVGASFPVSFGTDNAGEMYIVDIGLDVVWKVVPHPCQITNYCTSTPNSVGAGAVIGSQGSTSVTLNDFVIDVAGGTANQPGLFFYGPNQVSLPFGNGVQCVGSGALGLFRLNPPLPLDVAGEGSRAVDMTSPPLPAGQITAGSEWNFQFWYRDPQGGGAGYNLSDGLSVVFCP